MKMKKRFSKTARILLAVAAGISLIMPVVAFAESNLVITGSTTVLPIAQKCAEVFMQKNPGVNISVRGGGSGTGIASLLDGNTDIADASRAIKDKEIRKALEKGIEPKPTVVAKDGIAVVVNPSNSVNGLSISQIKAIYTGKITNWSAVGGPNKQIVVISRDSSSGTFETFNNLVLNKERVKPDALLQASNKAVATVVTTTPGAIGYVGLGYLSSEIKDIKVNGEKVTKQGVVDGSYPISRPLFMYTNGKPSGTAKKFLDFITGDQGQRIAEEVGYVGLK
jgi:phosphate transport system substrate-binding protein